MYPQIHQLVHECLPVIRYAYPITDLDNKRGKMHITPNQQQYQIQIKGHLPESWSDWFNGLSLTQRPDGVTVISGTFSDQAALFGVLWRIRDLGLTLLSVQPLKNKERNHE